MDQLDDAASKWELRPRSKELKLWYIGYYERHGIDARVEHRIETRFAQLRLLPYYIMKDFMARMEHDVEKNKATFDFLLIRSRLKAERIDYPEYFEKRKRHGAGTASPAD